MTRLEDREISRSSDRSLIMLVAVGFVLYALATYASLAVRLFPYTLDDSYITFRYAANLAAGHGLVFNPGEYPRAEGITSPLYAGSLALAALPGFDVPRVAKVSGLLA